MDELGNHNSEGAEEFVAPITSIENRSERILDPESLEAATQKLALLQSDNFTEFGIRFMNIDEYRSFLSNEKVRYDVREQSKEIFLPGAYNQKDGEMETFSRYAHSHSGNWHDAMKEQTDWHFSLESSNNYRQLMKELRNIHSELPRDEGSVREGFTNKVSEALTGKEYYRIDSGPWGNIGNALFVAKEYEEYSKNEAARKLDEKFYGKDRMDAYAKQYGQENLDFLVAVNNDKGLLAVPTNLRKLVEISTMAKGMDTGIAGTARMNQYHVGAVIHSRAIRAKVDGYDDDSDRKEWGHISKNIQPQDFLGVIQAIPLKELREELVGTSFKAKEWAHPVFDYYGTVRYPKEVTNSDEVAQD